MSVSSVGCEWFRSWRLVLALADDCCKKNVCLPTHLPTARRAAGHSAGDLTPVVDSWLLAILPDRCRRQPFKVVGQQARFRRKLDTTFTSPSVVAPLVEAHCWMPLPLANQLGDTVLIFFRARSLVLPLQVPHAVAP